MKRFECSFKNKAMERVGVYKIEDVLPFIVSDNRDPNALKTYDGHEVKMWSLRYQTFKKSLSCVSCGFIGKYFALEKCLSDTGARYHFNLYGVISNGEEVLITKDHIIPKDAGGKDHIDNLQTMCKVCNEMKANNIQNNMENHLDTQLNDVL